MSNNFNGFTERTIFFFRDLKLNNNKEWFEANRNQFEEHVMDPAKRFVVDMGEVLRKISTEINAIPSVDKSIFRTHRDTRFSKDKSPYKTHLGIFFWEGRRVKMECPGFYFHLEPPNLMLGSGLYMFPKEVITHYRDSVVDAKHGEELTKAIDLVMKKFSYNLGGEYYKQIPKGYDPGHKNARLLLHNGLHIGEQTGIPEEFFSSRLIQYCYERFRNMTPLHKWLVDLIDRIP
jgi:uncharacterized protein (TIGR02453 family)